MRKAERYKIDKRGTRKMKRWKRILAMLLCVCMVMSGTGYTSLAAEETGLAEDTQNIATDSDAAAEAESYEGIISYMYIDEPNISAPGTQNVLVGLSDGSAVIDDAVLYYTNNTTGAQYQTMAVYLDNESALFTMDFESGEAAGCYSVTKVEYYVEGVAYSVDVAAAGINAAFGVDCQVETVPDAMVTEEDDDTSQTEGVVVTDAEGNVISESDMATAIFDASDGKVKSSGGSIVVVLDAGHGNEGDTGAVYTWNGVTYVERDINLKIAQYCKAALELYTGVTVYMTRTDNVNGLGLANGAITDYAASVNADILVSIHNNSASATSANGSEVYYPNENYNSSASATGKGVADAVLAKLTALGLKSRGVKIRNQASTDSHPYYPDGSVADYYGIIRQSKLKGFPGIIIEHAFLTNESDAVNYLGSDEALKKLGEADAAGIAQYFGLTTGDRYKYGDAVVSAVKDSTDGQYTLRASGVPDADGVLFQVTSSSTGTTKEYGAISGGDGCWYSNFNVYDFNALGEYVITACVKRNEKSYYQVGSTTITVEADAPVVSAFDADGQKTMILIADNLVNPSNVKSVTFGVWNEGLSDLHWYTAQKASDGRWLAFMAVSDYKKAGSYYTDAYAVYGSGESIKVGSASFNVANPTAQSIEMKNENKNNGTFDIVVSGVTSASGVSEVSVPVWTAADLSDLYWYTAQKQSDGTYVVHADIKNHKYHYGVYAMQAYITGGNGVRNLAVSNCSNYQAPQADVYAYAVTTENTYFLVSDGVAGGSNVTGVRYGVWNEGLSDLRWYDSFKDSDGRWLAIMSVNDYKKSGTYGIDAYAITQDGNTYKIGSTQLKISGVSASISVANVNEDSGTFDVIVSNIVSPSGVAEVRVPAWTYSDLSDLHWYTAARQSDGTYKVTVDAKNHGGHYGVYAVQAYVTASNGIDVLASSLCYRFISTAALYQIVGSTCTNVTQMVAYYNANATYPSFYANSDAPTIESFCQLYMEECAAEGIRAEVAFCQAMKETGFLRYGGAVKIEQYNMAGIGATDSGGTPATFGSVREGIRAQVQHLKAYAATSELANPCVDPRFSLVTRGSAMYVEWLGIKDNPYGKGWASDPGYGYSLRADYINKLLTY